MHAFMHVILHQLLTQNDMVSHGVFILNTIKKHKIEQFLETFITIYLLLLPSRGGTRKWWGAGGAAAQGTVFLYKVTPCDYHLLVATL